MRHRIQKIFQNCDETIECILIKNASSPFIDENFFYVTDLTQGIFEGSCALLYPDGELDLLISELEAESARHCTARQTTYTTKEDYSTSLQRLLRQFKTIGVNATGIAYSEYRKLTEQFPQSHFLDVSSGFSKTRLIKDEQEILRLKNACKIADETMATISDSLAEEMTENELAAEINYSLQSLGAEKPAFETISSFGKNTAEPHYSHGDANLKNGDFIVCDFGACYKKYNSDITRTFVFGLATDQQKEMYETVLQAQQVAFQMIKPGVKANEVHQAVQSFIDSTKFKGRFIHSTGHSLGLAVHDGGGFTPDTSMELEENMILTVEPGVYLPGIGGVRIEDDICVKKEGMDILTRSPCTFVEVA
jgi:Xaa-Pro dipeptidase